MDFRIRSIAAACALALTAVAAQAQDLPPLNSDTEADRIDWSMVQEKFGDIPAAPAGTRVGGVSKTLTNEYWRSLGEGYANAAAKAFQAGRAPEEGPGLVLGAASAASAPEARADAQERQGDPDPDLLSSLEVQSEELAEAPSPAQEVFSLERRRIREGLSAAALHPEVVLIGSDGRPAEPELLARGDDSADLHLVDLLPLGSHAVQSTVHVLGTTGSAVHTALWTREGTRNELGEWLLRHLQVTLES